MDNHKIGKETLFECIGVQVGIYAPYGDYASKKGKADNKEAGVALISAINETWDEIAKDTRYNTGGAEWSNIILSAKPEQEAEIAGKIAKKYFKSACTNKLVYMLTEAVSLSKKSLKIAGAITK